MPQSVTMSQRFHVWLSGNPDDAILRWIFRSIVAVTIAVLCARLKLNIVPDETITS